jgi:hypothetical protein
MWCGVDVRLALLVFAEVLLLGVLAEIGVFLVGVGSELVDSGAFGEELSLG